jgi:1-phosphofructokinase
MTSRIITVTLNPAIDETITLENFRLGAVNRARGASLHAGGKGVNVASCLADWGLEVTAAGILGTDNAGVFELLFAAKRIAGAFLHVPGETRTNIKLSHDGETTDINLPGLTATPEAARRVLRTVLAAAGQSGLVVLAGSLPGGLPPETYATMIEALNGAGARVLLDSSGPALERALAARHLPFCIKPNRAELEAYCGQRLERDSSLIAAARRLIALGVGLVVISLGAEGALFVTQAAALHARLPAIKAASTVGAGDAMVAGITAALAASQELENIARLATAFAVAKLGLPGPNLPPRAEILRLAENVQITNRREGEI